MQIRPTGPSACPLSRGSSACTYVCLHVCVCVCVEGGMEMRIIEDTCRACVRARVCVCVYMCARALARRLFINSDFDIQSRLHGG